MFEFDVKLSVTQPSKGKLVPREVMVPVKAAKNRLDCLGQVKKALHKKGQVMHVLLDVECFKRNIRKERVRITDDELDAFERSHLNLNEETKPDFFRKPEIWEF